MDDESLQVLTPPQGQALALHSCIWCKRTKKKCDRILPGCTQCIGKGKDCSYTEDPNDALTTSSRPVQRLRTSGSGSSPAPTQRAAQASHPFRPPQVVSPLSNLHPSPQPSSEHRIRRLDFPTAVFLDWELFKQCNMEIPKAAVPVPSYVSDRIGDIGNVESIAAQFFDSVHAWMPIISKKRFYEQLGNPTSHDYADFALLVLCMKLAVSIPPHDVRDAQTTLYLCAKRYFLETENTGIVSLQTLQAQLLITIYEAGHAIYPGAFNSLGSCVSQSWALGIHWGHEGKEAPTNLTRAMSWVQVEEQHRAWWAVIVLDRYMNIGCPERPLSTPNPHSKAMYPADDSLWDEGTMPNRRTYSTSKVQDLDGFALLAKAATLLGSTTDHVAGGAADSDNLQEAMRISYGIRELLGGDFDTRQVAVNQMQAVAVSARLLLQDFSISQPQIMDFQYEDNVTPSLLSEEEYGQKCSPGEECEHLTCTRHSSPFLVTMLYLSTVSIMKLLARKPAGEEGGEEEIELYDAAGKMKKLLTKMRSRWTLANTYLELLEAREVSSYR